MIQEKQESKQMHRQTGKEQSNDFDEVDGDGNRESMLRKLEAIRNNAASAGKMNHEPRFVVETMSEVDILDDGYHWQKYRQKIVKENPYLRSSYKCTSVDCPARKHVERALHDPKAVISTYEARHNHEAPT